MALFKLRFPVTQLAIWAKRYSYPDDDRIDAGLRVELSRKTQLDLGSRFVYINYGFVEMDDLPKSTPRLRHVDVQLGIRYRL